MKAKFTHGIIGIGNMAQVILRTMLERSSISAKEILVSQPFPKELKKIAETFKVKTTTDNREVAGNCHYLWLGVKPFLALEVFKEIQPFIVPRAILISMMAGVSTSFIRKSLEGKMPILRLMPNTPAKLGEGMTGVFLTRNFPKHPGRHLLMILQEMGEVFLLKNEKYFDVVTGLSGSGPAFVYTVAQGLIEGGIRGGLSPKQARLFALQTMRGATAMLQHSHHSPQGLTQQVLSKKGTTEAGLKVLKKYKTAEGLSKAVSAATKRSKEISRELDNQ